MRVVMFILGVLFALAGLLFLLGEDKEKTRGTMVLLVGLALLVLGSDLGNRVKNVSLGEKGLEMGFAPEPASLTPQQVAGAGNRQQTNLASQASQINLTARLSQPNTGARTIDTPSSTTNASLSKFLDGIKRRQQERTATLHQALASKGFTPAPDPKTDLSPGSVIRIGQDGSVTPQFSRQESFPQLKIRPSNFDFVQFTSLGGTKTGFTGIGSFECEQGFQEDMDLWAYLLTPVTPSVDRALQQDPSLHVVRSVIGCYGKEDSFTLLGSSLQPPAPISRRRYILGFQTAATQRR